MTFDRRRAKQIRKITAGRGLSHTQALEVLGQEERTAWGLVQDRVQRLASTWPGSVVVDLNAQGNFIEPVPFACEKGGPRKTTTAVNWPDGFPGIADGEDVESGRRSIFSRAPQQAAGTSPRVVLDPSGELSRHLVDVRRDRPSSGKSSGSDDLQAALARAGFQMDLVEIDLLPTGSD